MATPAIPATSAATRSPRWFSASVAAARRRRQRDGRSTERPRTRLGTQRQARPSARSGRRRPDDRAAARHLLPQPRRRHPGPPRHLGGLRAAGHWRQGGPLQEGARRRRRKRPSRSWGLTPDAALRDISSHGRRAVRGGRSAASRGRRRRQRWPRQSDRRAHRLQRRLRAADGGAAEHARRAARAATTASLGLSARARAGHVASTSRLGARRAGLARLRPGRDLGLRRPASRCGGFDAVDRVGRSARERPGIQRGAAGRASCGRCARRSCSTRRCEARPAWRSAPRSTSSGRGSGSWTSCPPAWAMSTHALFVDTPLAGTTSACRFPTGVEAGRDRLRRVAQQRGRRVQHPPRRVRARLRAAGRGVPAGRRCRRSGPRSRCCRRR